MVREIRPGSIGQEQRCATADGDIGPSKGNPGKLNYGSPGQESAHHLAAEVLKRSAGLDLVHVPTDLKLE